MRVLVARPAAVVAQSEGTDTTDAALAALNGLARVTGVDALALLHARVVLGDPQAVEELASTALARLRQLLRRLARSRDPHDLDTAAEEAIGIYLERPDRYDPGIAALAQWLAGIAVRRLRKLDTSSRSRLKRERAAGLVFSKEPVIEPSALELADFFAQARAALFGAARSPREAVLVQLRLDHASIEERMKACGLEGISVREGRAILNREWEKLTRRARRRRLQN